MTHLRRKPRFTADELERHIATRVIEMIETEGLNWIKGWIGETAPMNGLSSHEYSGSNIFMTRFWMLDNEIDDPRFVTKKQVDTRGGKIRAGEKGIPIFYYGTGMKPENETKADTLNPVGDGSASASVRRYRFAKIWYVWNVTQIEWDEPFPVLLTDDVREPLEREFVVDDFCTSLGIPIIHRGSVAVYSPTRDVVVMPPTDSFIATSQATQAENYYSTLLHELVHATGHKKRLDRESLHKYRSLRPFEELVAELGSAMLCREFGISPEPREDNAAYIKGWCQSITDKPDTILKAASAASKAVTWMWDERNGENHETSIRTEVG